MFKRMQFVRLFLLFFSISLLFSFCFGRVQFYQPRHVVNRSVAKTIIVDQSDHGDFNTIQAAIDSIPPKNADWVVIKIAGGTYTEKVLIPKEKPFIALEGDGTQSTIISWGEADDTKDSYSFGVIADNVVVKGISIKNTFNHDDVVLNRKPAVAALVCGDKVAFYRCSFLGLQDTLWDCSGRHFFKDCYIEGAVDFIFGAGQSIYEDVDIMVTDDYVGVPGFITAQGRENPNDPNGFVFNHCIVRGNGKIYLGRAWRASSRVLFYKSTMSDVVMPAGWDAWEYKGHEDQIVYAEVGNSGPGAATSQRVPWEKKLSSDELDNLASRSFIDQEGWIDQQP